MLSCGIYESLCIEINQIVSFYNGALLEFSL